MPDYIFPFITCFGGSAYGTFLVENNLIKFSNQTNITNFYEPEWEIRRETTFLLDILAAIGSFLGTLITCYPLYRYGRVKTVIFLDFSLLFFLVLSLSTANYYIFVILKLCKGIYNGANFPIILVILKETARLQKDLERNILIFQSSTTIGIFGANLLILFGNWKILFGVELIYPMVRLIYFAALHRKGFETPLYKKYGLIKSLEETEIENSQYNLREDTLLKDNFTIGNLFGPEYIHKLFCCVLALLLNQTTGVNLILKNSCYFDLNSDINYVHLANLIGGLLILLIGNHLKKNNPLFEFYKLNVGYVFLLGFLAFFSYYYDEMKDSNNMIIICSLYCFVFQICVSYYYYFLIASFLPDIGIFVCLLLHWIFSMINANFAGNQLENCFLGYCSCSIAFILLFDLYFKKKIEVSVRRLYK